MLNYAVSGDMGALAIPHPSAPMRRDELWRHTCCEVFLADDSGYFEFNFSPSTEWAAYRFDAYLSGMKSAKDIDAIRIATTPHRDRLELTTSIPLRRTPSRIALSAVIEELNGRKSYWALAHTAGKPDFHHADSFIDFPDERP